MTDFILAIAAVFIAAGALLIIANQLDQPIVPFYIIAGLIIGPFVTQAELIELALWGIAFLVFVFGIQVDLGDLQSVLRDGEVAAFTQLIVVAPIAFIVGYLGATAFGFDEVIRNAIYFSAAATLSSTLVGARMLESEIRNNLVFGRLASSVHFFDDIVAIGVLVILSAEVLTDAQLITSKIGYGILFLLAGLFIYRHIFPQLIRAAEGVDELILMGSISILIAFLAAAEMVGISIVIGAFAAGLAIRSEGADAIGVRNGIESIKDFFSAIFFVTVGALVTVPTIEVLLLAGALIALVVVFNPLVHTLAFVYEGYDGRTAFYAGSSLNQVSELALVIAIQAWLMETIAETLFYAIILAAAVTMIFSTVIGRYEQRFYNAILDPLFKGRTKHIDDHSSVDPDISDHVVIVGYGRQSRRLIAELELIDVPYVVIENDPVRLESLESAAANYVFGDAMAEYPMQLANIEEAALIISTADHRPVSEAILDLDVEADVILRADTSPEARELLDAGALFVAVPNVLASDQLLENVRRVLSDEGDISILEENHRSFLTDVEIAGLARR